MSVENYTDFLDYYINPIDQLMKRNKLQSNTNISISQCIEDLHTLYYLFRNEIWCLSPKLMTNVANTIYNIYTATARGVYYLKSKLEDLVFLILFHFSSCKDHLKLIIFSRYQIDVTLDENCESIQIKYIEREHQLNLEDQVDLVLDLVDKRKDSELMKTMFITCLEIYADVSLNEYSIMEKLFIVKTIHYLIEKDDVQKSISGDPEIVLNLIKSILKRISEDSLMDVQVLSIALMILGCVLENMDTKCIKQLDCFIEYLSIITEMVEDVVLKDMVLEMQHKIVHVQNTPLREPVRDIRTIDDVLFDTRDKLLPCRSHALIELKKIIESGDKMVIAKKSAILIVIQV